MTFNEPRDGIQHSGIQVVKRSWNGRRPASGALQHLFMEMDLAFAPGVAAGETSDVHRGVDGDLGRDYDRIIKSTGFELDLAESTADTIGRIERMVEQCSRPCTTVSPTVLPDEPDRGVVEDWLLRVRFAHYAASVKTAVDELSLIRQDPLADSATLSVQRIDGAEAIMPATFAFRQKHEDLDAVETVQRYVAPMTSVNSVIAAIAARRPDMSDTKTQLLLFFCQGHHLANFDDPLFTEPIYATDRGVTVDDVPGKPAPTPDSERALTTIGHTLTRYGNLSPADLRTLVQASMPWQLAMKATTGPRIEWAWLRDWFRRPEETDDPDDEKFTKAEAVEAAAFLRSRRGR